MQTALIQAQRCLSGEMGKRGDSIASSECDSSTDRFLFVNPPNKEIKRKNQMKAKKLKRKNQMKAKRSKRKNQMKAKRLSTKNSLHSEKICQPKSHRVR